MGRLGARAGVAAVAAALVACGAAAPEWAWHRVERGETLHRIAARYRVTVADIAEANALTDPNALAAGDLLYIPAPSERRQPVRGRAFVARAPRTIGAAVATVATVEKGALAWPVDAAVSSRFGMRDGRPHEGIDLAAPDGTAVRAAAAGRVVYAGGGLRGYGNLVMLRHDGGLLTVYAHNSSLLVSEGTTVARGQPIALSGHSGRATAPHVHFEVREGDVPRDPELYLPPHP